MKIEHIGDATLYLGDCMDVLRSMQDKQIGAVVMDPPYGMEYSSGYATDRLWSAGRRIAGDEDTSARDDVIDWADGRACLCFGTWKIARPTGTRMVLVWDKGGALGMGALDLPWKPDHEEIYVLGRGFSGSRDCGSVVRCPPVQSMAVNGRQHPTEKPVRLMVELVRKTSGVICDPFMGSGTTGVACAQLGRKFIGIEREPRYFDIARRRIEQAYAQGRLFDYPGQKSTQEALPL